MLRPALAVALLSLLLGSAVLSQAPANRAEAPAQRFAVSPGAAPVVASLPTCIGAPAVPGDPLASFLVGFEAVRARALATGRPTCLSAVADGPELENLIGTLNALRVAGQSVQVQPRSLQIDTVRREVDGTLTVTAQVGEVRTSLTARGLPAGAPLRDDRTVLFKLRPAPARSGSGLAGSAAATGRWVVVDDAMPPRPDLPANLTGAYAQALEGVVNRSTALALADSATGSNLIRLVAANGFAIHPQSIVPDFFTDTGAPGDGSSSGLYARNAAEAIPSLITIDSALHVYHILQGRVQVSAELTVLPTRLQAFLGDLLEATAAQQGRITGTLAADALRRNAIYLAVSDLLAGGSWPAGTLSVDEAALAAREANLIRTHLGRTMSPVLGRVVDYGQFAPHGHYAMSVTLTGYAQALDWLHVAGPALGASRIVSLQAVLLGLALRQTGAHGRLMDQWHALADPIAAFAGAATPTLAGFEGVLTAIYGADPGAAAAGDPALLARLMAAAPAPYRFSLLPVAEQPDVALVAGSAPSGLEVLSALGSGMARGLQTGSAGGASAPLATQGSSLYGEGLALLRDLTAPVSAAAPSFMHGAAWSRAALASALGWWSEMHQDPQPLAGLLDRPIVSSGKGALPVARPSYVEPAPLAWQALARLAAQLSALSSGAHLLDGLPAADAEALQTAEQAYGQVVARLAHVADDELAGRPVADADVMALQDPDRTLGAIALAAERHVQGPAHIAGSQSAALAEIAGRLEAGEGPPQELWALVPIGGSLYLARGAVYSYYEFAAAPHAISDATWQTGGWAQRLQPKWTAVYER